MDSIKPMAELLGGSLNKKSMNTIPFKAEMRTLAYVMIHNLYPVMNLTTLLAPRTIFLYDLFTHKEIDICGHICWEALEEAKLWRMQSGVLRDLES